MFLMQEISGRSVIMGSKEHQNRSKYKSSEKPVPKSMHSKLHPPINNNRINKALKSELLIPKILTKRNPQVNFKLS